jgi:hypothetical protein
MAITIQAIGTSEHSEGLGSPWKGKVRQGHNIVLLVPTEGTVIRLKKEESTLVNKEYQTAF